jgi:hypothetical protein
MKFQLVIFFAVLGLALQSNSLNAQDHGHLHIGATGTNQNDRLIFSDGTIFATNSLYIKTLTLTNGGRYAGYFQGNITLTGLAATPLRSGPEEFAAAPGSQLFAQIVSVEGPFGGAFNFWDSAGSVPAITVPSGGVSTNIFIVSENDGSPGSDPYGHIHGRRFTATKAGIYAVTFRAFDFSTNGAGGGSIHTASDTLTIFFQAGINIASVIQTGAVTSITFGTTLNQNFALESAASFGASTNWMQIGDLIAGGDNLQTLTDTNGPDAIRFYRIRIDP